MDIRKTVNGSEMVVALDGRLDIVSSPVLADELTEIPGEITTLVLELENLKYTSSAGLRVMFQVYKDMKARGGEMVIRHASEFVLEVLDGVGFLDIFTIEK